MLNNFDYYHAFNPAYTSTKGPVHDSKHGTKAGVALKF